MADKLPPDPYKTLGVDRDASIDVIKKAYRKAALRCHPDKTNDPAAIKEFHSIQEAYDILGDEQKKEQYEATLRLHALRNKMQASRSSTFPSTRDFSYSSPRPSAPDDRQRAKTDWSGWSSTPLFFTAEERVPASVSNNMPPPRSTPLRQSTFDYEYYDSELNRSSSRKDGAHFAATRRPAASKSSKTSESKTTKADKSSSKEKARSEARKVREREVQQERGRKFSATSAAMPDSDSSDDTLRMPSSTSRSQKEQIPQPRRRSDTTDLRDSRRPSVDHSYRHDKLKEQEEAMRRHRTVKESAPPGSYRPPNLPDSSDGRRSSRDSRPGLVRRSSSRTATSSKEPGSSSRPASRRSSPVRRSSRTREAMDSSTESRRYPSMPNSHSAPTGIRIPDDPYEDYNRRRPSLRHSETVGASPQSSSERFERERTSTRSRSSRTETLERSASDYHRLRKHYEDAPPVSSGLRHGENHDSGYSTSSPSETPVETFAPPEPKKKYYSYADEPFVAEVRAPARDKKTSYPPSAAHNDRSRTTPSRSTSFTSTAAGLAAGVGLSRRASQRAESSGSRRPSVVTRTETMPLPGRSRGSPLEPLQTSFSVSSGRDASGYLFGEQRRAASPEMMEHSPRTSRREPTYRVPMQKVNYAKTYSSDDISYGRGNTVPIRTATYVPDYYGRIRREDSIPIPRSVASPS